MSPVRDRSLLHGALDSVQGPTVWTGAVPTGSLHTAMSNRGKQNRSECGREKLGGVESACGLAGVGCFSSQKNRTGGVNDRNQRAVWKIRGGLN